MRGGVVISYHNKTKDFGAINTFTAFSELNSITHKVLAKKSAQNLSSIIASQGLYRFSDKFFEEHPEAVNLMGKGTGSKIVSILLDKMPAVFVADPSSRDGYLKILGRTKSGGRIYRFIRIDYIQNNDYTNAYKVFIPEANGSGAIGKVLCTPLIGEPLIGEPLVGVTDTFICCGPFATKEEAVSALKYIKTKFARTMLGVKKITQHNSKSTWELVPLQDFTSASDIDWSKSIPEIDRQLYAKYGLSEEEVEFIESHVKEME